MGSAPEVKRFINLITSTFISLREQYEKQFIAFKPDKRLRWLPQLGTVTLELELEDRTVEVVATPIQAALIELFSDQGTCFTAPAI